jgi:tetratricopeptide (TPR) repeat protein
MEKIEKLKTFLLQSPDDPFLNHALALEYMKAGDESAAKEVFINILTRDPSYIGSYYHLARLLEQSGDPQKAKYWYEKGLEAAKKAGDQHAYRELQAAYENLMD